MDLTIKINLDNDTGAQAPVSTVQTALESIRSALEYFGHISAISDFVIVDENGNRIGNVKLTKE